MAIKRTNPNGNGAEPAGPQTPVVRESEAPKFRENPDVNAKIDAYIAKNPKEWAYIQSMPRERLERSLVLQSVQKQERQEKMRAGIAKKLDENPELKAAYQKLVQNLPPEQQEQAMAKLFARTARVIAPPKQAETQAQGARV